MNKAALNIVKYGMAMLASSMITYYYFNTVLPASIHNSGKPVLTTSGIVHICPGNKIALIERGKKPSGIAMFGGHVEAKESPEAAFLRELKEELHITDVTSLQLVGVYGNYGRDPRQHSVEITYSCTTPQLPLAGSDAKAVILYTVNELKNKLKTSLRD